MESQANHSTAKEYGAGCVWSLGLPRVLSELCEWIIDLQPGFGTGCANEPVGVGEGEGPLTSCTRLLSTILDQLSEGIAILSPEGEILLVNRAFAELHGYEANALLHRPAEFLEHTEPAVPCGSHASNSLASGEDLRWRRRRDGTHFAATVSEMPLHAGPDRPFGRLCLVTPVRPSPIIPLAGSTSGLAKDPLLTTLVNEAPISMAITRGALGPTLLLNRKFVELFGYTLDDVPDVMSWWQRTCPNDAYRRWAVEEWCRRGTHAAPRNPGRLGPFAVDVVCKDRSVRRIEIHQVVRDEFVIAYGVDLTDHTRAEQERQELQSRLHHAQKMDTVGQLAAGIAHDFNNLIMVIMGHAAMLRQDLLPQNRPTEALAVIEQAAEQAQGVTRALLTFSRRLPVEKRVVDLRDVTRRAVRLLRRLLPASIELSVDLNPEVSLHVRADATQLQQIIMNLATNARDAMPNGGVLRIALDRQATDGHAEARLTVADTGCGIATSAQKQIFEPFFTTKERGQGTGLGLAIVHGIVADHDGRIELKSEAGAGSTFSVILPLVDEEPIATTHADLVHARSGRGETILLAEDNAFVRAMMVSVLKTLQYRVTAVEDGDTLLHTFREEPDAFQILILDIDLPRRAGPECLTEIRRQRPDLPAIVVSGAVYVAAEDAIDPGVPILRKPFHLAELAECIRDILEERR